MTEVDVTKREYHSEFNSDQTINYFHAWYWDMLHGAEDSDGGKGGQRHGPWPRTQPLFDKKDAIVMGLFGLDCAHACGSELHPVYAMALHVQDSIEDDVWAVFVRNWGDEGYCSSGQEEVHPGQPFTFAFRLRRPGASAVTVISAAASDPAGQHATVFYSDHGGPGAGWSGPVLVPGEGAVITFTLPPPVQRERINGMLHLKWSVSATTATPVGRLSEPTLSLDADEPEGTLRDLVLQMTPAQRQTFFEKLGGEAPPPLTPSTSVSLPMAAPASRDFSLVRSASPPTAVQHVPDVQREQRDRQLREALHGVFGDRFPLEPPH
jgi:hypothetical protein